MFSAARFALAANLRFHGPFCAVPEAVHLGTFERAFVHSLSKQRLKIRRKRRLIVPWPVVAENGFAFENTGHLGVQY